MKKTFLLKSFFLLCALVVGSTCAWAADPVTIASFTVASHTGWTINADGNTTPTPSYYLLTTTEKYIESPSITFSNYTNIKIKIKARKYGGPSGSTHKIYVKQGSTTLTSYTPSGTSLAYSSELAIMPTDGNVKLICPDISEDGKGSGVSEILITGEEISGDADSEASFADVTPSLDLKDAGSYTQTATAAAGYSGTITYSMTANTASATINETTGEVTPTKAGSVTVKATAAKVDGVWAASSATYTLTVTDSRTSAGLAWSATEINIPENALESEYTLPTLSNPNSLAVTYTITGTAGLASESAGAISVDTSVKGSATVKASFDGDRDYKPANVSYTITVYDPSEKGTLINPYSVADIIAMNPTSTSTSVADDVYVTGYIIGTVNSSNGALINTNIDSDTNLAIADDPEETENFCSVQLPSGTIRTAINAKPANHPYYVGVAKVLVRGDILKYCSRPGVKNTDKGSVVGQKIKVTSAGLATYCTDVNLKFNGSLEAYIAKEEAGEIKLYQVTNVPANTGILLRAVGISVDTAFDIETTDDTDDVAGNVFVKGNDAAVATSGGGYYNYILSKKSGVVGFYNANGNTVAKNRAYIHTTLAEARIAMDFSDATGIDSISNKENNTVNSQYYNLAGQRVAQPTKGLYIVNGKKVVIK